MTPPAPHHRKAFLRTCWWGLGAVCAVTLAAGAMAQTSRSDGPELVQPPVCSERGVPLALRGRCEITRLEGKRKRVKVTLTAKTAEIDVAGYRVETENYNGKYLSPIIEANPGDTVAARLVNKLKSRDKAPPPKLGPVVQHHAVGQHEGNPTNLHFFHGGIVTPRNDREQYGEDAAGAPGVPKGDNVYVDLQNGGARVDYDVPIPGEGELDASVLDKPGKTIAHPAGLNWYHSHRHGISSAQVLGGLSGLLSVGEAKANVRAKCQAGTSDAKCKQDTKALRERTIVRYALLRDILLKGIKVLPVDVSQVGPAKATAVWEPEQKDFFSECPVYERKGPQLVKNTEKGLRKGYCQPDGERSAWLFTLNGQRFPTITVDSGKNLLLRLGNLSANVAYWLELSKDGDESMRLPLTILSLDGVVPAKPIPEQTATVDAHEVADLLLMPASRVEFYVRNDAAHTEEQVYILRTKGLNAGIDIWPEVQLARVRLKSSKGAPKIALARNAPVEQLRFVHHAAKEERRKAERPSGCVRDLKKGEHRVVRFWERPEGPPWGISSETMVPPKGRKGPSFKIEEFELDVEGTVGKVAKQNGKDVVVDGVPFEQYMRDGKINWAEPHVCIELDSESPPGQSASYQQLWVLKNDTQSLHNFHIHQMKFRLARRSELTGAYNINLDGIPPSTCPSKTCTEPDYKLYEEDAEPGTPESYPLWHDTTPVPSFRPVFIIMSFTAKEQIGRYVFHCHILKHEDTGLMAPIEVWNPFRDANDR